MNWKKWIKYAAIILGLLLTVGFTLMTRDGIKMYGGLTDVVDQTQYNPQEGTFIITNVNILSPEGDSLISHQSVLIEEGLIKSIDSALIVPSSMKTIDGSGKYLIPGLIDTHVHLFQSPNDLLLYLANGVTDIRELIGEESHLEWKQEIENGRIGPRMFVASPRLGTFDDLEGWFMSWSQGYMNIKNAEDAREKVKSLSDLGYDGIKIYSQLSKESYLALTETAKTLDMKIMGHLPWSLDLSDIWENGQSDIAHFEEVMNALQREFNPDHESVFGSYYGKEEEFLEFVEERSQSLANNLIRNDISVTSTLWLTQSFVRQKFELEQVLKEVELDYQNPGISEWVSYIPGGLGWLPGVNRYKLNDGLSDERKVSHRKYWETYGKACALLARNFSKMGVKIMTGTDANLPPTVPGFSLHDELSALSQAGMSPSEVLRAATSIPATWLERNAGKILPGYEANLVLLDKNPLQHISNTRSINTVINRGKIFDRDLLDSILTAVKDANDNSRSVNIDQYRQ